MAFVISSTGIFDLKTINENYIAAARGGGYGGSKPVVIARSLWLGARRVKGSKWLVVDGQGILLGGTNTSASPAEVTLAEEALETIKVLGQGRGSTEIRPKKLIGDKSYDVKKFRFMYNKNNIL